MAFRNDREKRCNLYIIGIAIYNINESPSSTLHDVQGPLRQFILNEQILGTTNQGR